MNNDKDINIGDASTPPIPIPIASPLTRPRVRQLNHQVSSFLSYYPSCLDLGNTCTLVLIRNQGKDRKGEGLTLAGFGLQQSANLWSSPRLRTDSDWGASGLFGKFIKPTFIRIQSHVNIYSAAAAKIQLPSRSLAVQGAASPYFGLMAHVSSWVY